MPKSVNAPDAAPMIGLRRSTPTKSPPKLPETAPIAGAMAETSRGFVCGTSQLRRGDERS